MLQLFERRIQKKALMLKFKSAKVNLQADTALVIIYRASNKQMHLHTLPLDF